jgi:type II secretory pathway pseudopilin PulG
MRAPAASLVSRRAGITLTEILLGIMILGVGLVSLATLFPIGLLRLREAQRLSRSAYLVESAAADVAARGLLNPLSFLYADLLNVPNGFNPWYVSAPQGEYDPLIHDRATYTANPFDSTPNPGPGASTPSSGGYGLPFAYDPLWRYQTGYANGGTYLFDTNNTTDYPTGTPECRFASGVNSLRQEGGLPASAHGLQRLTNFNRPAYGAIPAVMPQANMIPSIFVSPEDVVWQEPTNANYWQAFTPAPAPGTVPAVPVGTPSTVVPDLTISQFPPGTYTYQPMNDWRFSWMVTAQQINVPAIATASDWQFPKSDGAAFEGNIVIFENRPFAYDATANQAAGENVYEGVFGFSSNVSIAPGAPGGYGVGADRTVLIRWFANQADPVIRVGDWIADVTYERAQYQVNSRFFFGTTNGVPNLLNNGEWDNLPAQRCFWYQVQKVTPAQADPNPNITGGPYRSMVVYVNRKLEAKTLLQSDGYGTPVFQNAVLVCPNVVNVVPQTFFVR